MLIVRFINARMATYIGDGISMFTPDIGHTYILMKPTHHYRVLRIINS